MHEAKKGGAAMRTSPTTAPHALDTVWARANGCPWDREQTPTTIKRYLLEEVYEVVDAVDHQASDQVADELGDLIFMAIFHQD